MNARYLTLMLLVATLVAPSIAFGAPTVGTAKARGDFGSFQAQGSAPRWVNQSRRNYRYSSPRYSAPAIQEVPSEAVAQAPEEARRFSQAPAADTGVATQSQPCPDAPVVVSQPNPGRRYSYAPATQYSGNPGRRYSGYHSQGSRPAWALPKTDPGKYSTR